MVAEENYRRFALTAILAGLLMGALIWLPALIAGEHEPLRRKPLVTAPNRWDRTRGPGVLQVELGYRSLQVVNNVYAPESEPDEKLEWRVAAQRRAMDGPPGPE